MANDLSEVETALREGMVAIRGLLDGRFGTNNTNAALQIADSMHNMTDSRFARDIAFEQLEIFRRDYPSIAQNLLPQTYGWIDSLKQDKRHQRNNR